MSDLRNDIKQEVKAKLPEDEHDYTADWVYDIAIALTQADDARRARQQADQINSISDDDCMSTWLNPEQVQAKALQKFAKELEALGQGEKP